MRITSRSGTRLAFLAFTAMAWLQMRWVGNASGPQIVLALVLAAHFFVSRVPRVRVGATIAAFLVLFAPGIVRRELAARADAQSEWGKWLALIATLLLLFDVWWITRRARAPNVVSTGGGASVIAPTG